MPRPRSQLALAAAQCLPLAMADVSPGGHLWAWQGSACQRSYESKQFLETYTAGLANRNLCYSMCVYECRHEYRLRLCTRPGMIE